MNRLQKKCLIATTGFHLLLILVLVFGSAFFVNHAKPDPSPVLDVIPAKLVDDAFSSGVKNAAAPVPAPPQPPQPIQQPQPPEPVQPTPPPQPQPKPEPVKEKEPTPDPVKQQKLLPDDLKPVETTQKSKEHKIEVNKTMVTRNRPKTVDTSEADAAREAKRQRDARSKAFQNVQNAVRSINKNASSATTVDMPGSGSVSYANYTSVVKSIYDAAWTPPGDAAGDTANVKVSVTIARDGTVVSSRIKDRSGDTELDASVQRALDRVTFIAPFPDGANEKERTFVINFNLKAKRMLG